MKITATLCITLVLFSLGCSSLLVGFEEDALRKQYLSGEISGDEYWSRLDHLRTKEKEMQAWDGPLFGAESGKKSL
ncbi:MAG: hypothetical protein AAGJ81_13525 [Verrucomicrobiota bacterium]